MEANRNANQHFARSRPSYAIAVALSLLTLGFALSGPLASQADAVPSVVDQYTEQVPSAGGDGATSNGPGSTKPDDASSADPDGAAADSAAGNDGEAIEPGDDPEAGAREKDKQDQQEGNKAPAGAPVDSSAGTTEANGLMASDDDSGMGFALPVGMVLVLAAVTAAVIYRRRAGTP